MIARLPQLERLDGKEVTRTDRIKAQQRLPSLRMEIGPLAQQVSRMRWGRGQLFVIGTVGVLLVSPPEKKKSFGAALPQRSYPSIPDVEPVRWIIPTFMVWSFQPTDSRQICSWSV